jgi:hypothetical protein
MSGKSADGLIQALLDAEKTKLQSAVTAGKLTATQESSLETQLQTQITNLVNGAGPARGFRGGFGPSFHAGSGFGHGFGGALGVDLTAASTYLGLTTSQITTNLQGGQTLAQIANAMSGKSADGLIQALLEAEKTKLQSAVTAGKLTATQESSLETQLQTQITSLVNGAGPTRGFRGGFGPNFHAGGGFGLGDSGGTAQTAPFPTA